MTPRIDERLNEAPMAPVQCDHCGAGVLVRKASWQQTSVQWNADAAVRCPELRDTVGNDPSLPGCGRLRDAIAAAATSGRLRIPAECGAVESDHGSRPCGGAPREVA
ncbi:ferredoxin [Nocardia sp. CDC186]|uniref:Ferredoxin n=1 Tax=Nocardia implantans TaxID=3108168 RepID=A0ABU6AU77_9NOCA|nr:MULTISPECIES: ferredoxin [unclassified Nocardia]MEA3527332.1 ferredoxin [Nocardia sp. CDC192]MEB3511040.1 ferredoxin [Nocardia sp. CDC186]